MSRPLRHDAIRAEIQKRGHVPSVRVMAKALELPRATLAEDYQALGLKSRVARGRPAVEAPLAVPVSFRIPAAAYDSFCHTAQERGQPVTEVIRSVVVAAARLSLI